MIPQPTTIPCSGSKASSDISTIGPSTGLSSLMTAMSFSRVLSLKLGCMVYSTTDRVVNPVLYESLSPPIQASTIALRTSLFRISGFTQTESPLRRILPAAEAIFEFGTMARSQNEVRVNQSAPTQMITLRILNWETAESVFRRRSDPVEERE